MAHKRHLDLYSGGERTGKLAKIDAKGVRAVEAIAARESAIKKQTLYVLDLLPVSMLSDLSA